MYFAFGRPKFYSTGSSGAVVDVKYSEDCELVACLTYNSVVIWSGDQHRIRLGHCTRKSESVATSGPNRALAWAPDNSIIAVITTGGHIYLYVVRKEWMDPLEFAYVQAHHIPSSLSTPTTKLLRISQASSFLVPHGGAVGIIEDGEVMYIITKHNYIVVMRWTGDIVEQFSLSDIAFLDSFSSIAAAIQDIPGISISNPPNSNNEHQASVPATDSKSENAPTNFPNLPPGSIVQFTYAAAIHTFSLVLCNGSVVVMQAKTTGAPLVTRLRAYILSSPNGGGGKGVHVALNACHRLLAVGCDTGDVRLYKIPQLFIHSSVNSSEGSQQATPQKQRTTSDPTQSPRSEPLSAPKLSTARVFTLIHWGIKGEDTGPVSIVSWTRDERALAVGWAKRGFSLWSINGCRLVCTIPQLEGFGPKSSANDIEPPPSPRSGALPPYFSSELARDGVVTLAWGPNSYHLIVVTHDESVFMQLSMVKSCLACNPTFCYAERILLQADDRLLFMCYKGNVPGEVEWKHLHIPHTYLLDNWPMKFAAMSRDGTQLAVTGRRGLILYNNTTGRWKMFGDRNQEQDIICCALCWYKHIIVVASFNETIGKYELLLFPRQHLSYNSLAGRQELPRRRVPHLMDCNDSYLVVFTKDSCLYLYSIATTGSSDKTSVYLQLFHQVSLASVAVPLTITLLPESVQPFTEQTHQTASSSTIPTPPQCLIHYASGKLVLLHLAENREHELAADVEQPWLGTALTDFEPETSLNNNSTTNGTNNELPSPRTPNLVSESAGRTLWAYGEQGLTVWVPFPGPHKQLMSRDRSLDFDNEVYPVGFVSDLGIVVGLTQGVSIGLGSPLPFFEIHTKTHPFLHSILRNKIESFDDAQALSIAKKFEYVPHFAHSLELLLHEVLESECENPHPASRANGNQDHSHPLDEQAQLENASLLSRVAHFMRNFPQFPDIVVQCARKTDAAYWQMLFDGVGDPKVLFDECLLAGKLSTAASYLKILQNICHEGHVVSRLSAMRLLGKVLDNDDVELAGELTRFLGPFPKSPSLTNSPKQPDSPTLGDSGLVDAGITEQEVYYVESQLQRYARKLLMKKQLRHLLLFAWRVGHSLGPWLVNERSKSAVLETVEEMTAALTALHLHFYIPKPERLPPIPASVLAAPNLTPPASPRTSGPPPSPSPLALSQLLPPASPLSIAAASTPFTRKLPPSLVLSTSSMIPDVPEKPPVNATTPTPSHSVSSTSLSLPSMRDPLFLQDSIEYATSDLTYLQEEMLAAKCTEWGLIIATVLMNIQVIVSILRSVINNSEEVHIWEKYRQLLISQSPSSQGYYELREFLDELLLNQATS